MNHTLSLIQSLAILTQAACGQNSTLSPAEEQPMPEERTRIPADSIVHVEPGYLRVPLDIPINIGGSFGEIRPNHFHAGIDIRTNGQEGLIVRACAHGFVSRVRVSPYGYGHALYIDHPNGYTTVYAHLQKFSEPVASFVKAIQYEQQSFEVDIYPEPGRFPVERGEVIARSGNTGRSTAPHLHFEIRETESEWPVNPLLLTDWVKDDIPPVITKLWTYAAPAPEGVGRGVPLTVVPAGRGVFKIPGDTHRINITDVIYGIEVSDRHNGNSGNNDINSLELWVDGVQLYGWNLRKFSFDDTRCVNAHTDYAQRHERGTKIHRLYRAAGNELPAYSDVGNGVIPLSVRRSREVIIRVRDAHNNISQLRFWVEGLPNPLTWSPGIDTLPFQKQHSITQGNITLTFEPYTFFDTVAMTSLRSDDNCLIPVRKGFQVSAPANVIDERLRHKALFIRNDLHSRTPQALSSSWSGDTLIATSTQLGRFEIAHDTTAPTITPVNNPPSKNFAGRRSINFRIKDDLSGIARYDAYIYGKWVLAEYDAKNNLIKHEFEKSLAAGGHEFRLVVADAVGNVAESVVKFMR